MQGRRYEAPARKIARPTVKLFYLGSMDASHKVDRVVKGRRGMFNCTFVSGEMLIKIQDLVLRNRNLASN